LRRKVRDVAGIAVFMRPIQNLQLGGRPSKAQYQYILQSVQADELNGWALKLQDKMRPDQSLFRDVTSDSQLRGLQASLKIDRDRANTLGVSIDAVRSALYSAFGERQVSTIYTSTDSYQVILEVVPGAKQDESAFSNIYVRSATGALVPMSAFTTVERTVGTDVDQPRRPAAGGDGLVQPRAWRCARRRDREDRALPRRAPDAAVDHHDLRRRCGRVQELAGQPGRADRCRAAGDLRAARRAVRELRAPADRSSPGCRRRRSARC
jgi:hypothetical protein